MKKCTDAKNTAKHKGGSPDLHAKACEGLVMKGKDGSAWRSERRGRSPVRWYKQREAKKCSSSECDDYNHDQKRRAYYPIYHAHCAERPWTQKVGGKTPFFSRNDTWPVHATDGPYRFIAQFVDPTQKSTILQVWMIDPQGTEPAVVVRKIPVRDFTEENYVFVPPPPHLPSGSVYGKAHCLQGWRQVMELPDDGELGVLLKVDGYGTSVQGHPYRGHIQDIYQGRWGDGGSLHIMPDLQTVVGDMG